MSELVTRPMRPPAQLDERPLMSEGSIWRWRQWRRWPTAATAAPTREVVAKESILIVLFLEREMGAEGRKKR